MILFKPIITVQILYFRQDYKSLIQSFIYQTEDLPPDFPQIHRFLNFWKEEIDAPISEVLVSCSDKNFQDWKKIDWSYRA